MRDGQRRENSSAGNAGVTILSKCGGGVATLVALLGDRQTGTMTDIGDRWRGGGTMREEERMREGESERIKRKMREREKVRE